MSYLDEVMGPNPIKIRTGRGASAAAIAKAEAALGLPLPESYRRFLETCGVAWLGHDTLYGIVDETLPPGQRGYDFVSMTRDRREQEGWQWPHTMVIIADDGRGGDYCLDTAEIVDGDCVVAYHDHEADWIDDESGTITPCFEKAAPTFAAWLKQIAKTGSMLPPS